MRRRETQTARKEARKAALPRVIPPCSIFRLVRSDRKTPAWKPDIGRVFRIGYYSQQDGLDVIWLVNEEGSYEQTTNRDFLLRYFEPIEISDESDFYGKGRPQFPPLVSPVPGKVRR
jgi:hypothetical protein